MRRLLHARRPTTLIAVPASALFDDERQLLAFPCHGSDAEPVAHACADDVDEPSHISHCSQGDEENDIDQMMKSHMDLQAYYAHSDLPPALLAQAAWKPMQNPVSAFVFGMGPGVQHALRFPDLAQHARLPPHARALTEKEERVISEMVGACSEQDKSDDANHEKRQKSKKSNNRNEKMSRGRQTSLERNAYKTEDSCVEQRKRCAQGGANPGQNGTERPGKHVKVQRTHGLECDSLMPAL